MPGNGRSTTRVLPLDVLASGPADSQGFGPEHAPDRALEAIINGLHKHPGAGLELLRISLSNRVVRIRHHALRTLTTLPAEARPRRLRDWIGAAATAEPDGELRAKVQTFLDNGTTP
jgi:hypothetical protein